MMMSIYQGGRGIVTLRGRAIATVRTLGAQRTQGEVTTHYTLCTAYNTCMYHLSLYRLYPKPPEC